MRRIVVVGAVLGIILLGAVAWLRGQNAPATVEGERLPVERGAIVATVNATGNVEANQQVSLSFRASGRVAEVAVREGEAVTEGQRLARLETTDLEFAVAQAEANVAAQQAQLRQLEQPASPSEIEAAEASLASARAALERLQQGPDAEELRAAEASLVSAQENLAQLRRGADPDEVAAARGPRAAAQAALASLEAGPETSALTAAQAELERAEAALQQAQAAYDQVAWRSDIGALPQSLELQQATINYEVARANYDSVAAGPTIEQLEQARASVAQAQATLNNLLQGSDPAALRSAEAQVAQAEANLEQVRSGPTAAADLRAAEAQVAQAEANLEQLRTGSDEPQREAARATLRQVEIALQQAEANLEGAELVAPFDGVVGSVAAQEGELMSSAQPMITLVDLSSFRIEVQVDEADIGQVRADDTATIIVDSLPDQTITGTIDFIAPVPTISQGVVSYPVRIVLPADAAEGLRVGMTATVDIVTEEHENVLLVPTRAIEIDRTTGQLFVERLAGETLVRTEVEVGLRNEAVSEIVSGLSEGDVVVIRPLETQERLPPGLGGS